MSPELLPSGTSGLRFPRCIRGLLTDPRVVGSSDFCHSGTRASPDPDKNEKLQLQIKKSLTYEWWVGGGGRGTELRGNRNLHHSTELSTEPYLPPGIVSISCPASYSRSFGSSTGKGDPKGLCTLGPCRETHGLINEWPLGGEKEPEEGHGQQHPTHNPTHTSQHRGAQQLKLSVQESQES